MPRSSPSPTETYKPLINIQVGEPTVQKPLFKAQILFQGPEAKPRRDVTIQSKEASKAYDSVGTQKEDDEDESQDDN